MAENYPPNKDYSGYLILVWRKWFKIIQFYASSTKNVNIM